MALNTNVTIDNEFLGWLAVLVLALLNEKD